jgi:hypothetical protein
VRDAGVELHAGWLTPLPAYHWASSPLLLPLNCTAHLLETLSAAAALLAATPPRDELGSSLRISSPTGLPILHDAHRPPLPRTTSSHSFGSHRGLRLAFFPSKPSALRPWRRPSRARRTSTPTPPAAPTRSSEVRVPHSPTPVCVPYCVSPTRNLMPAQCPCREAGDCVLMRPSDSKIHPYVARMEKMEADGRGSVRVR